MRADEVAEAYNARADLLSEVLGTSVSADDPDRQVIEPWAQTVRSRILDVGSGTGRWSGHLTALGHEVDGIEPAAHFVDIARRNYPAVPFRLASINELESSDEQWAGVLAWYSLIHMDGDELPAALATLRRLLDENGSILLSFFTGPRFAEIGHPATTAYLWPMETMTRAVEQAGFEVTEQHAKTGSPHAYLIARTSSRGPAIPQPRVRG